MNIKSNASGLTMRQAIREVKADANALIEQMERKARGWDTGAYRDDDTTRQETINQRIRGYVGNAFALSERFTGRTAQYDADQAVMDAANNL